MLRGLRKASENWLGKVVMALVVGGLVIAFVIWGIGDIFRGGGRTVVAKIGGTEITGDEFRQIFNDRLQQLSRQVNRPITPDQARAFGLDQQLLGQLVSEAALDDRIRSLHLGISEAEVARRITQNPAFQGMSGSFDPARFESVIRQSGFTEQRFIAEQRRVALRRQFAAAVMDGVPAPSAELEAFHRFENEQRSIEYVTLERAAAGDIPAPSPEVLQKYFEDRKITFRAPEYRKLVVLSLSPDEIAKSIEVSDADAKIVYDSRRASYTTPEKREVQQILFPTEDEAKQAADKLAGGAWFEAIASERKLKPSDINLGLVDKAAIVDKAVADAAFSLKQGEVSAPIKGRFGVSLLRVNRIEPTRTLGYAEAEGDIKKNIAADRARSQLSALRNKIEDEQAGGSRLDEVAQKLKLSTSTIPAVDRSGRTPDGNPIAELPQQADILSGAFASQIGVENEPVQAGTVFVWYEVTGITPARERPLDEVKERVEAAWKDDEVATRLKAKAAELVEKLKAGTALAELASANGLKVEKASGVKRRGGGSVAVPQSVVQVLFKTPTGGAASAEGKDSAEQIVFRVTDITTPPFDASSADMKKVGDQLKTAMADELLTEYVAQVQNDLGLTVNRAAMNQAIAAGNGQ